jgi:hypothetical protein
MFVEIVYARGRVELKGKTLNALDKFVLAFSRLLEKYVDYVIVRAPASPPRLGALPPPTGGSFLARLAAGSSVTF